MYNLMYYGKDLLKLFSEYYDGFDGLDAEVKDYISSINDYDPIAYAVIDDEKVVTIDSINGMILGTDSLPDFINQTLDYIRAEIEN